jgi:uncharacterized protein
MTLLSSRIRDVLAAGRRSAAPSTACQADARLEGGERRLIGQGFSPAGRSPSTEVSRAPRYTDSPSGASLLEAVLGATCVSTSGGEQVIVERLYAFDRHPGLELWRSPVVGSGLALLHGSPDRAAWGMPEGTARERLAFVDVETTGLSGGAGTCVFLVGIGTIGENGMTIGQVFLPGFSAEPPLLQAVADRLQDAGALVTFNGKAFDLPVLETRWLMNRMTCPFAGMDHLDLLHPARRLWRRRSSAESWSREDAGCSLGTLERVLLEVTRPGDVPGFEIPARYFAYLRSGDPHPVAPVLEHNRLDLLSLAALTALALRLVEGGADAARDAAECLALGRIYERAGAQDRAAACYDRVAAVRVAGSNPERREEALFRLAIMRRRQRRFVEAAELWQEIVDLGGRSRAVHSEAARALAVHCEHRSRDLIAARAFALRALSDEADPRRAAAARHRLLRVDRKLSVQHKGGESAASLL